MSNTWNKFIHVCMQIGKVALGVFRCPRYLCLGEGSAVYCALAGSIGSAGLH